MAGVYRYALVSDPGDACADTRADTTNAEEDTEVLHTGGNVAELDNVANNRDDHAADNEPTTVERLVRVPGDCEGSDEAKDVWRDRQQIRVRIRVSESLDD